MSSSSESSFAASPPAKRRRIKTTNITRSDEIWHSDGSVVLQAEQIQFKVHWASPTDIEGCPLVELSVDAQDVGDVLKALYIPTFHCEKTLPLPVVRAFIRLGRKYDFRILLKSALARITSKYPSTLKDYDNSHRKQPIEWYNGVELDLMALASEHNILSALPCLYYSAVELWSPGRLFDKTEAEDGTFVSLPRVDLRRCLEGRERLLAKQCKSDYTFAWARKWKLDGCTDLERWDTSRKTFTSVYLDESVNALDKPGNGDYFKSRNTEFCAACMDHMIQSMTAGRKKMWEDLPGIFDLPPGTS